MYFLIVGLKTSSGYNRRLLLSIGEISMPVRVPMPLRVIKYLITSLLLLASIQLTAADGDAQAGKLKSYTCTGCHGIPGYNNVYPTYKVPKIGGQNYAYLVSALKAYRDGERNHGTMELQANALSDQDMQDVSAYFSGFGQGG